MSTYSDTGTIRAARSRTASERIPRRIIAGGTSAERKAAERGNYMNKLGFMATFVTGGALLAILAGALAFMMGNFISPSDMKHVEINGRVIPISGADWSCKSDAPLLKGGTTEGVLVMNNGSEYIIRYIEDSDAFTINDRFGYYELKEM